MAGLAVKDLPAIKRRQVLWPDRAARAMRRLAAARAPIGLWYRLSLRGQILAALILANFVAGCAATAVVVYDARKAAKTEMTASIRMAERLVHAAVERSKAETSGSDFFRELVLELGHLRHVRILFADSNGTLPSLLPVEAMGGASSDAGTYAPRWFTRLVRVENIRREMRIVSDGHLNGSVVLVGHADDETAEVWRDITHLAIIAFILNLTVIAILYFALGRLLHPLTGLALGLRELERGQFRHRLSRPRIRELADITDRFNALADRLRAAKDDNGRLTRRLVTVQDDERRQIAAELHDEMGPCLFGIKANISSLDQLASEAGGRAAEPMRERLATLGEITDRIQVLNRSLLGRIRPMALGHVPLADIVSSLAADFRRLNPGVEISTIVGRIAASYGDSVDLTIYRCLQEGITNAERHSGARTIVAELAERQEGEGGAVLQLSIRDDGRGIAPDAKRGLGLIAMDERVRALGGAVTTISEPGCGTRLEVAIPLEEAAYGFIDRREPARSNLS